MKFLQIFIPVAILHLVVIAVILLQPGCQVRQAPPPPVGDPAVPSVGNPMVTSDYRPTPVGQPSSTPINRQAPMRPVGSGGAGGMSSNMPSAFNANLPLDQGGPLLRPVDDYEDDSSLSLVEMEPYTIVPGDTLSGIARRFGVSVDSLREANALSGDRIGAGETLMIPVGGESAGGLGASPMDTNLDSSGQAYVVVPGDNLTVISRRYGVSVAEIKQLNNLSSNTIKVGQKLYVPERNVSYTPPPPPPRSGPVATNDGATYTVRPGDTPITIARRLKVSHQELMRVNGITDPTRMKVGQVLIVPGASAAQPARTTTASPNRNVVPRIESNPPSATVPLRSQPSRPTVIDGTLMDPAALEAQMNDVPVSPVEVVEPTGNGG